MKVILFPWIGFIQQYCIVVFVLSITIQITVAENQNNCLKFLAVGDWGTPLVANTAKFMAEKVLEEDLSSSCAHEKVKSVLFLGDNFYENGLKSNLNDPLIQSLYLDYFGNVDAFQNISFSVVVGNHDHRGDVETQIAMSTLGDHRWYFPSRYYSRIFTEGDLKVLFVFIDTWDLIGGEAYINPQQQTVVDKAQLSWIEQTLKQGSNIDFKFVVGHYPIRSMRLETAALVNDLLPILMEAKVDGYIFG
jgi:hypothetical protein